MRRYQIYVNGEILKSLSLIAKTQSGKTDDQGMVTNCTAEDVAESLLKSVLKEKYPQLTEHFKTVDKLEKEVLKTL